MSLTLGEKLQQAREARGITISEVAEQTRISSLYLEAIENNDYRTLPGGIFNKGFVKSYARYVGLDEQEALQDYSRILVEQQGAESDELKVYKPEVLTDAYTRSSSVTTMVLAVLILVAMTAGILWLLNYFEENPLAPSRNNSNTANNATRSNTDLNAAQDSQPNPSLNEVKLELSGVTGAMSVSYWIDDKLVSKNVTAAEPLIIGSLENASKVKISYYKGFTPDKVQLSVNGKQIAAPNPPAKGNVIFEITKENVAEILRSGQISAPDIATPTPALITPQKMATPKPTPAATATPANVKVNGNR